MYISERYHDIELPLHAAFSIVETIFTKPCSLPTHKNNNNLESWLVTKSKFYLKFEKKYDRVICLVIVSVEFSSS